MTTPEDVIRKAKIVSMCWTTAGQRIDSDATLAAINDLHDTVCAFYGVEPKIGFTMAAGEE